ncbi:MAG4940 family membrane protein [Mycoplasmopsis cricetuli]|uniref:MAG4940 family membrane protein n=1 Tax=Mycoplasmopsis cricetuli TaxID=171283 RepID=UPI000470ED94|nr:hypothetical protein [Mycoplasmopsis cricetuli]
MTNFEKLNTFYDANVFSIEFIGSLFLTFFVFMAKYFVIKTKKGNIFLAISYTSSVVISIVFTWTISRFLMRVESSAYLNPINVIVQSFIQGITKNLNGLPLINGIWYLLGAQLLGSLVAVFFLFFATLFLEWYLNVNQKKFYMFFMFFISKTNDNKNENITFYDLFKSEKVASLKHFIKELFFISIFILLVPFIGYINDIKFQVNNYNKTFIMTVIVGIILIFSSKFNFFMFSIWINLVYLIVRLIFKKITKNEIINFLSSLSLTIFLSMLISIFYLLLANSAKITFSLS